MTRILAAVALLAGGSLSAQVPSPDAARLVGQSDQTYKRLLEAQSILADGKPAEAAAVLQRILDEAGDDLVQADAGRSHYRPARRVAQRVLVTLPPDALQAYRDRTDGPARQLLEAGKKTHDPRPLQDLLDRYFVSRPAEEALLLLGELAFERGEFRTAEGYWRRLLPQTDPTAEASFPDPKTDRAAIQARVILALIFQRDYSQARAEFEALRSSSPKATGRLAGRDGPYAETLQALLDRPPERPDDVRDGDWTTLGGSASRSGRVSGELPMYWPSRPTWTAPIPADAGRRRVYSLPKVGSTRSVGFHPVVLDGVAYIADAVRVFGFDPKTGRKRFEYDLRSDPEGRALSYINLGLPLEYDADFTLTAADGRLFARLGVPTVAPPNADAAARSSAPSYLVCFGRPDVPTPNGPPLERKWVLAPPAAEPTQATWEGAPVWADGRLYAAFARFDAGRVIHAVACYDDPPGKPLWVADLADSPQPGTTEFRHRHELLTLAGGNLVYCTQTGVVVAVDARTGKPAWAVRYPKTVRTPATTGHRDISPPVAHGGRVFVAPTDSDHVLALDARTGRVLWQAGPILTDHILGVSRGRLVVAIAGPVRGIRGLNVATGSDREPDGWAVHDDPLLGSFGRGLVSDNLILWPTRSQTGLFLLSPADGLPLRPPVPGPHGNLAFADGVLLVATPTELRGYVFGATPPSDRTLIAERALSAGRAEEARRVLEQTVAGGGPLPDRVRAAGRLLTLEPPGGGEAAAGRFLAGLKLPVGADAGWLYGPAGVPVRLRTLAGRHFGVTEPTRSSPRQPPAPIPTGEFDVLSVSGLGPEARVERVTEFPSAGFVPLRPFDGTGLPGLGRDAGSHPLLLVTDGRRVLAYQPGAEKPTWAAEGPADAALTHAAIDGDRFLLAGARGVAKLRRSDGGTVWTFALPDTDPLPSEPQPVPRSAGVPIVKPGLSDFTLAGNRLVARLGDHHLIALDTATGSVAWVLDSAGRNRYTPFPAGRVPRFSPGVYADERVVIAQLSTGRRWVLNAETGGDLRDVPTLLTEWAGPPVRVTADEVIVPTGPGRVATIHTERNRGVATFAPALPEASLTGRPPGLRPLPGGVVVGISRNQGTELHRLRGPRLVPEWAGEPPLIPAPDVNLSAADADEATLYVPAGGRVSAVSLSDGQIRWSAPTGSGEWRVRAGRKAVIAYPTEAVPIDPPGVVAGRVVDRFPFASPVGIYGAWTDRTIPVLMFDSETGRVLRRLDLPATGPVVAAHFGPEHNVVVTAGRAYWLQSP